MKLKTFKHKKTQILSFDSLLAVAIFIIILSLFFIFFSSKMDEMPAAQVQREAIMFKGFVSVNTPEDQTPVTLIVQNQLQYEKLASMAQEIHQDPKNYEKIKAQLNIKSDFCLFFEDSEGNILPLILPSNDDETTLIVYGVGNPELNFKLNDTIVCGQVYKVNRADGSLSRYTS